MALFAPTGTALDANHVKTRNGFFKFPKKVYLFCVDSIFDLLRFTPNIFVRILSTELSIVPVYFL